MKNLYSAFVFPSMHGRAGAALLVVLAYTGCAGCSSPWTSIPGGGSARYGNDRGRLAVASWNVQALFDDREDGTEYAEYRAAAGWDEPSYRRRLELLAKAVRSIGDKGPDLLALQEVENAQVLSDLSQELQAISPYPWVCFSTNPGSPLGVGLLSRFPLAGATVHSSQKDGIPLPRPILEVRVEVEDAPVILLICHWKSKLGGEEETEPIRRAAAGVAARRLRELEVQFPEAAVLVVGDLNENVDEFTRRGGVSGTALMPDTPQAFGLNASEGDGTEFLLISPKKPPEAEHFTENLCLYEPWSDAPWPGSYYYQGAWETIDHMLLSPSLFDSRGWDFEAFSVIDGEPFTASGLPSPYNPRICKGLSDHLPLVSVLRRN
jgi:endonuclease/exonuclease/phosphatase family metal-dependent hydrolase